VLAHVIPKEMIFNLPSASNQLTTPLRKYNNSFMRKIISIDGEEYISSLSLEIKNNNWRQRKFQMTKAGKKVPRSIRLSGDYINLAEMRDNEYTLRFLPDELK